MRRGRINGTGMTALSAPYRLLRRDGDAGVSRAAPPGPAVAPPTAPDTSPAPLLSPSDIARVIAERHFAIAFQPVVRLADRQQVGHEALLRLRPPPGMPTLPTRSFVEAAQACGL